MLKVTTDNLDFLNPVIAHLDGRSMALEGSNLSNADFSGADLSGAAMTRVNLTGTKLFRTNLRGAVLFAANLDGVNQEDPNNPAELEKKGVEAKKNGKKEDRNTYTNLSDASLSRASLLGANLFNPNSAGWIEKGHWGCHG